MEMDKKLKKYYSELSVEKYGDSNIVCRYDGVGNKYKVVDIIEKLFNEYKNDEWEYVAIGGVGTGFCVCSQKISETYIIKHCSGIYMTVGSSCVKQFSTNMYNHIKKGSCMYCNTPLTDRRNRYQKDSFCNEKCSRKYKSEILKDTLLSRDISSNSDNEYYSYGEKCDIILEWAKTKPRFDTKFVQSISDWIVKKEITTNQANSIDNIINRCKIKLKK
jgi:hypothetical protein